MRSGALCRSLVYPLRPPRRRCAARLVTAYEGRRTRRGSSSLGVATRARDRDQPLSYCPAAGRAGGLGFRVGHSYITGMKRPSKRTPAAPLYEWRIVRLKSTPAALIGLCQRSRPGAGHSEGHRGVQDIRSCATEPTVRVQGQGSAVVAFEAIDPMKAS
jgi:hypothetical protein